MGNAPLFGEYGRNGIPADLRRILLRDEGPDRLASLIIHTVEESLGDVRDPDKPGARPAPGWVRGLAQVLMQWFASEGLPATPLALKANAYALSLVSPDTRNLLIPKASRDARPSNGRGPVGLRLGCRPGSSSVGLCRRAGRPGVGGTGSASRGRRMGHVRTVPVRGSRSQRREAGHHWPIPATRRVSRDGKELRIVDAA